MLIRDPIHGDISLNRIETAVIDLPDVQRLRGVKQLGTASFVYPGCVHSRFDHSLGVNAVAKRIIAGLRDRGLAIGTDLETLIGVGALLHDVTHVPFGHTLEDERRLFPRHDKGDRLHKLLGGRLGDELAKLGMREALSSLLAGDDSTLPAWTRQVVASTIDADLLDYLRRDSYFAGLAQNYDDRIFHYFVVVDDQLAIQMSKHGMERPDARSETVELLRMRYFLTERVYYHHTKVAAGAMISKAVELAHEHNRFDEDELLQLTDGQLLERLGGVPNITAPDRRIAGLVERLRARKLLKRGYVVSALTIPLAERQALVQRFHQTPAYRRSVEQDLARALGCDAAEVILYCPALTVMKEALATVVTANGARRLNQTETGASGEIRALEERYAQLWRFYVFVPEEHAVRTAPLVQEIVGVESEHRGRSLLS